MIVRLMVKAGHETSGMVLCHQGCALPAFSFVFGALIDEIGVQQQGFLDTVARLGVTLVVIGIITMVSAGVSNACFTYTCKVIGGRQGGGEENTLKTHLLYFFGRTLLWCRSH